MTSDQNKGIASIAYNHLNLPVKIVFENNESKKIEYLYNAIGIKVLKKVTDGAVVTTTDYLSGYQYRNSQLQFFPTAEGYFKQNQGAGVGTASYVFNYTDHLGNVRVSYQVTNNVLNILEENNYYPFGMKHSPYNESLPSSYKYKYNGKEYQDELGLNMYDYGARNYDPAIGRWMNVDPLAEEFPDTSPYVFVNNNPLRFTDPTGMAPEDQIDPPAKKKATSLSSTLKQMPIQNVQGGYPGQGLDMLVTAGIQWAGEKISGSDVSIETSENVQFATSILAVVVSKGKNAKADTELTEQVSKKLGVETANGIKVTGFGKHALNRAVGDFSRKGVKPDAILDALKNPLVVKDAVTDGIGRQSQRFIGKAGEVVINPSTGKVISVNPTSSSKAAKLLKQIKE
jgi:RHS repeat-associated protein